MPLETATRKKIDLMLNNKGWNTDEFTNNCNVFTERAKTVNQNNKLKKISGFKKPPDYVLYETGTDNPIAIIEAKRKGQSVDDALTQAIERYAIPLDVKIIFAYDGAFFKSWHIESKKELYIDNQIVSQLVTEKKVIQFLNQGNSITEITPKIVHSRSELINIFKQVNQLLRKEGLDEGKERFYEFANILFLKLISEIEEERERNNEQRIVSEDFCWNKFNKLNAKEMYYYVNNTVLKELKDTYGEIFDDRLKIKEKTLKMIVDKLSEITLMDIQSDVKGDAFEYFLKTSITIGNDLGQYFTPRHIINLMINLIEPKYGEKIYDPTCGTGGFLIAAFNYIKDRSAKTDEVLTTLKKKTIYGRELTGTAKIAKMNMIITGDGHMNIEQIDTLEHPVKNEYDVVVANPPYGQPTDYGGFYNIPSNDGDIVFLQHIIDSLKDENDNGEGAGRAAVVIPEGVLFRTSSNESLKLRKWMIENCNIEAIISLPQGIFRPYTKNKTDILVFKKNKKGTNSIWFYELTEDGFELNSDLRKPSEKNDISDLLSKWTNREESSKSWNVSIEEIKKHNFDLMAKTYKTRIKYNSKYQQVLFSEIMKENKNTVKIDDDKEYQRLNIKWYGNGIFLRDTIQGKKITTKIQKVVRTNQFVVAEIDAKEGSFGIVPKSLEGAIVSSHYFVFDLDEEKIIPTFFDYLIRFAPYTDMIKPIVKGTTNYASIRPNDILNLRIPLPSLEKQNKIIERIKKQEKILDGFESIVNELKEGFIDQAIFDINESETVTIKDVLIDKLQGANKSALSKNKGNVKLIRITDIDMFGQIKHESLPTTNASKSEIERFQIEEGDILIARSGSIGKCAIMENFNAETIFASYLIRFRFNKEILFPKYLLCYLLSNKGKDELLERSATTTHTNINAERILTIEFPLPSLEIQKNIVNEIEKEIQFYKQIEDHTNKIKDIRRTIVMSLFS